MTPPIPLTLIGGYLGAGKTTLVNSLLAGGHGLRLAVLVNDFGEVDIDGRLVVAHDGETYTLANGCICCSFGDDLGETLRGIARADDPPDAVIVEASGVADARRLAASTGEWFGFEHHATLVLADAETVRARSEDPYVADLVRSQLAGADLVVLNKVDLVAESDVDELLAWCRSIGVDGPILPTTNGRVPIEVLTSVPAGRSPVDRVHDDHHVPFSSVVVRPTGPWRRTQLEAALASLPPEVVRVKGFVDLDDDGVGRRVVVQLASRRTRITDAPDRSAAGGDADDEPVLVVIAVGDLDPAALAAALPDSTIARRPGRPDSFLSAEV